MVRLSKDSTNILYSDILGFLLNLPFLGAPWPSPVRGMAVLGLFDYFLFFKVMMSCCRLSWNPHNQFYGCRPPRTSSRFSLLVLSSSFSAVTTSLILLWRGTLVILKPLPYYRGHTNGCMGPHLISIFILPCLWNQHPHIFIIQTLAQAGLQARKSFPLFSNLQASKSNFLCMTFTTLLESIFNHIFTDRRQRGWCQVLLFLPLSIRPKLLWKCFKESSIQWSCSNRSMLLLNIIASLWTSGI